MHLDVNVLVLIVVSSFPSCNSRGDSFCKLRVYSWMLPRVISWLWGQRLQLCNSFTIFSQSTSFSSDAPEKHQDTKRGLESPPSLNVFWYSAGVWCGRNSLRALRPPDHLPLFQSWRVTRYRDEQCCFHSRKQRSAHHTWTLYEKHTTLQRGMRPERTREEQNVEGKICWPQIASSFIVAFNCALFTLLHFHY